MEMSGLWCRSRGMPAAFRAVMHRAARVHVAAGPARSGDYTTNGENKSVPRQFTFWSEEARVGEIERLPVGAAERESRGLGLAMDDAAEFIALHIDYPYSARAAAINIPSAVNLDAIPHAGLGAGEVREHSVGRSGLIQRSSKASNFATVLARIARTGVGPARPERSGHPISGAKPRGNMR